MAIPEKLDWVDAETHSAANVTIPPLTPQLISLVIQQLTAQSGGAATEPQLWTAQEQNELRDKVNEIIDCLVATASAGDPASGLAEWAIGHTELQAKLTTAGRVEEYDALPGATAAQISSIRPGTNDTVWLNRNFRFLDIGDGTADTYSFRHGFTSGHIVVGVKERATGDFVEPHVSNSADTVTVNFSRPIGLLSHTIEVKR